MIDVFSISNTITNDGLPKLCRFCFRAIINEAPCIDIFSSKIGTNTIIEIVKNYFAVVKKTTYQQYLNGNQWTTEHKEVTNFELNNDRHGMSCICIRCLKTIIECTWFGYLIRTQNLKLLAISSLCTMLGKCTLIDTQGEVISEEKVMPAWRFERKRKTDELCNFWDACIFCFEHNGSLLFDIFLSNILGSSIEEVITTYTTTYKEECIYEKVHLAKSLTKFITVIDFQWKVIGDQKKGKICLNCMIPLIKIKALIERIRMTNEALPFIKLTRKLNGSLEFNIPDDHLDNILSKCNFKTSYNETIPSSKILEIIKSKNIESKMEGLDVIREISEPDCSELYNPVIEKEFPVYCDYCKRNVFGCSSFEDHVLKCLNDNVIHAVETHNSALCDNCLHVVFKKKETLSQLPMKSFKDCSVCKLWLYQTRDKVDFQLSFPNFIKKYF